MNGHEARLCAKPQRRIVPVSRAGEEGTRPCLSQRHFISRRVQAPLKVGKTMQSSLSALVPGIVMIVRRQRIGLCRWQPNAVDPREEYDSC